MDPRKGKTTLDFEGVKMRVTVRDFAEAYLTPAGRTFVCPACGSGTGPHRTAAFSIYGDGRRWHCFSCGKGGDVFELARFAMALDSVKDAYACVAQLAGMDPDGEPAEVLRPRPKRPTGPTREQLERMHLCRRAETARVFEAQRYLAKEGESDGTLCKYLASRGITLEKAREWGLGYDPKEARVVIPWKGADAETVLCLVNNKTGEVVESRGVYYHIDRDVTGHARAKYKKPRRDDVGPEPLYNGDVLGTTSPTFVVEGVLDALAVQDCGFDAVALNKAGDRRAADRILEKGPVGPLFLLLDNDAEKEDGRRVGQDGQQELALALKAKGVEPVCCLFLERMAVKDPFEAWEKNREELAMWLRKSIAAAEDGRQ